VAVSIRQHGIRVLATRPKDTENVVPATIIRNVFLGSTRDYMLQTADGTPLRVVTSPAESIPEGSQVWLHLPPEQCRAASVRIPRRQSRS
jgi:iron(III) transport system ATP-binding protein